MGGGNVYYTFVIISVIGDGYGVALVACMSRSGPVRRRAAPRLHATRYRVL